MSDCPRHKYCAYTGSEPGLCATCHATTRRCGGRHGKPPYDGWSKGVAGEKHPTLRAGQYNDPRQAAKANPPLVQAQSRLSEAVA